MKLPVSCPSCQNRLKVKSLFCENCETQVDGKYQLPLLAAIPEDAQLFIIDFVKSSGSLKEMAKMLSLSYPSVRNRLDEVIQILYSYENDKSIE